MTHPRMTLGVTLALCGCVPPAPRERLDFLELVRLAQRYALPAPPREAPLVLASTGSTRLVGSSSTSLDPGVYRPAFLLERLPRGRARVLMGWEVRVVESRAAHHPAIRPYSPMPPAAKLGGYVLDGANLSGFTTVVQLARRGDIEEATKLWDSVSGERYFSDVLSLEAGTGDSLVKPHLLLGLCLYEHLQQGTLGDDADLKGIHEKLIQLEEELPALFSEDEANYDAVRRSRFIRDLGRTVAAENPPEGSVEALLVEWASRPARFDRHLFSFAEYNQESDRPAREIIRLGLRAFPELARLAADTRLTRHINPAFMNKPEERVRLGELATSLLTDMAGSYGLAGAAGLGDRPESELELFSRAAVDLEDGRISRFHRVPLWFLGEKHPRSLTELCGQVPAKATVDAELFPLTTAVLRSRLAPAEKVAALGGLAGRLEGDPRLRAALQPLAEVDGAKCAALLRPVLARLPGDVDEAYSTCEAAAWTHVVMRLEDDGIWEEYLQAARNAAVGLRMEMMNPMNYSYIGTQNRLRRLAFLAAFLNDETVRDPSIDADKYDGPCAAFTLGRIEVRDFAAMKVASILGLDQHPTELWAAGDWARLRAGVREALKREKLPAWTH